MILGTCPVCKSDISQERMSEAVVVCDSCGHVNTMSENQTEKAFSKQTLKFFSLSGALVAALMIHTINWSGHTVEIIPLKAKQTLGMAHVDDLTRIAEICIDRKKPVCVEEAFRDATRVEPENMMVRHEYGKMLAQNQKFSRAEQVYTAYFKNGGNELEARYEFAKVLNAQNKIEDARNEFEFIINAKPDTLQITVTQTYVNMLFDNEMYRDAEKVITEFRERGDNARYFMEAKMQKIKEYLSASR